MLILHMKLILPKSSSHCTEFPIVCMIWYGWIQSPAVLKQQDVRWSSFRWSIPLFIDYDWVSGIDSVISTTSCSYYIWNSYCQKHLRILPNFILSVWFNTVEFNRLQCPNDRMDDNLIFAVGLRYSLTMFGIRVLIGLSRLLHAHKAYETDTAKIIAAYCRISYRLHDLIRLNSIVCHTQTTRCKII